MSAVILDSGARQEFPSGAVRDTRDGKGRFDLVCPWAIQQLALQLERGCSKYGERQWEQGMPQSRFFDSASRHLSQFAKGLTDEDHLLAAFWNLHCMVSQRERMAADLLPESLNDMPAHINGADFDLLPLDVRVDAMSGITELAWGVSPTERLRDEEESAFDIDQKARAKQFVVDEDLLHRDTRACMNLCDDIHGAGWGCKTGDYSCGDSACADRLIAEARGA